jgi:hypothetical protein
MFFVIGLKAASNKPYGIESGKILYQIYGGGVFTPEVNLSIEGREDFLFRKWGLEYIESIQRTEGLVGVLQSIKKSRSLKKRNGSKLYTVNFKNESIIPSKYSEKKEQIDFSKMEHHGTMQIASLECELWQGKNRKVCLHKGIILLYEKNYLGFTYAKKAIEVNQNATLSEEEFALPSYPIRKALLLRDKVTTTQTHKVKTLSDKIISAKKNIDINDRRYAKALNKFSKKFFKKEKAYFPLLLDRMSQTRVCLLIAESKNDANVCLYQEKNEKILSTWDTKIKQQILDKFDDKIGKLEARMPCINRALNIGDLAECMK